MSSPPSASDPLAARITCLVLDVDGVLTDGHLYYTAAGETLKSFHVRDGLGIRRLADAGVHVAIITARHSAPLMTRMAELGITHVITGCRDKRTGLEQLQRKLNCDLERMAYVGDDLFDLPAMRAVGLSVAVADAHPSVRSEAHWVTTCPGGRGAVRETTDVIVEALEASKLKRFDEPSAPDRNASFTIVIPARFASTRLPGKPLLDLAGKPMIQWVCEAAKLAGADEIWVATDDQRIADAAEKTGVRSILTARAHQTGTDRLSEVIELNDVPGDRIVVNVQGDEPLIPPRLIQSVAEALHANPAAGMATVATPIRTAAELFDPNVVKVVLNAQGHAICFSRAPIPWVRDAFVIGQIPTSLPEGFTFFRHVGIYAYRAETLRQISGTPSVEHERAEALEQLRALALGIKIHVSIVDQLPGHGIDTAADLAHVAELLMHASSNAQGSPSAGGAR